MHVAPPGARRAVALWLLAFVYTPAASGQEAAPLTNLASTAPRQGLPDGWTLRRTRNAPAALVAVTTEHALRIEARNAAGFAIFELPTPLPPASGAVGWRWRTGTPIPGADLRARATDDSPVRVMIAFSDRRAIFYSWGAGDTVGAMFRSWTGRSRTVVVAREARDADGAWRTECHRPFDDYRRAFGREPAALAAVGISADTEQLHAATWAEVADLAWWPASGDTASAAPCEP